MFWRSQDLPQTYVGLQVVSIVPEAKKVEWLLSRLPEMIDSGEVLVFANQIVRVEEVTEKIKALGHR